jgi:hypothetical protein
MTPGELDALDDQDWSAMMRYMEREIRDANEQAKKLGRR